MNLSDIMKMAQGKASTNAEVPPIDQNKLMSGAKNFSQNQWQQLVAAARKQGIGEDQIEQGLKMLLGK